MPTRIQPDEAAKHLVRKTPAAYPASAELARIQGNVILEIAIDPSGQASARRLVTGHSMLVQAAIASVDQWKYQPFEVNGMLVTALTFVMVTFGNPASHDEDRAEILFQDNFWSAIESAQLALGSRDYPAAEQQLGRARDLLAPVSDGRHHVPERWQLMTTMGHLAIARNKDDEAEQYYQKALALRQNDDKDAPAIAATLAFLSDLYLKEKRYDLARDEADRSLAIYEKNFRKTGSNNASAQQSYGRAVAYESWTLSKLAFQQDNSIEAARHCRKVLDFQTFLAASDHDSVVSACERAIVGKK
jgi:TonB family protein